MSECRNCAGVELVCENHPDQPWQADVGCDCGAGMPCPVCQPEKAAVGRVTAIVEWLEEQGELALANRVEAAEYLPRDQRSRAAAALPPRWTWQ